MTHGKECRYHRTFDVNDCNCTPTTPNKSEGAEWEREFDELMNTLPVNDYRVVHHDIVTGLPRPTARGTIIKNFIAHQRQQAYADGYKQGSFDKEADLELGVARQQAVAEFAREVRRKIRDKAVDNRLIHALDLEVMIDESLEERGIDLNTLKS